MITAKWTVLKLLLNKRNTRSMASIKGCKAGSAIPEASAAAQQLHWGKRSEMKIRKATENEMLNLWGFQSYDEASPTARFFYDQIASDRADFWTIDHNGKLIGELFVFKDLPDKEFADGRSKAYLCSFRINRAYQGRGLGTRLLEAVLSYLKGQGLRTVTIGVAETEKANIRLYDRLGFQTKVKSCVMDPCALDDAMRPRACPCFWLLSKRL